MANISADAGHGGKKSVDSEIPLVPFIDLLLCCILLVTAVWNQLASVQAHLDGPGRTESAAYQPPPSLPLMVRVASDGFVVGSDVGDEVRIPMASEQYDVAALADHLDARRRLAPSEHQAVLTADDGVGYASLVSAMDVLAGHGFPEVTVSGSM